MAAPGEYSTNGEFCSTIDGHVGDEGEGASMPNCTGCLTRLRVLNLPNSKLKMARFFLNNRCEFWLFAAFQSEWPSELDKSSITLQHVNHKYYFMAQSGQVIPHSAYCRTIQANVTGPRLTGNPIHHQSMVNPFLSAYNETSSYVPRLGCQFERPSLDLVTSHIGRNADHQQTIFRKLPNTIGYCCGTHLNIPPPPLAETGEKFLAVAKVSSIFTYGDITIVPIGRRYDANAWDGVLCAYMHATWLAEVAGNDFFVHNKVTVQIVPRDHRAISGPSGAAAMLCALTSLATGRLRRTDTAVTAGLGGATLQLAGVGGLRPKTEAVRDALVARLVMAEANANEWHALPADVKGAVEPIFVADISDFGYGLHIVSAVPANTMFDRAKPNQTSLYRRNAWDGFFAAYVHANMLATFA
ncbi:hypothetical protein niasHT_028813 [Heterodera trifolii]|uniref:Lon proteolytic domain-containing protein n=1 Tax=Heterodera trifolii TaxID=157864 RepID=A0ABD2KQG9_9BILA